VKGSNGISNKLILFSLQSLFSFSNQSSFHTNQIKSTLQFRLATLAATFAAHQSLSSSFSTLINGTGASGLSLLTFQKVYLSIITSHITAIFPIFSFTYNKYLKFFQQYL
jgi:hypothetical protein